MSALNLEAKLERLDTSTPWGFRMQGGKDFNSPLTIQRVTPQSLAAKCGLHQGDVIVKIGSLQCDTLRHKEAQDTIIACGNKLDLLLQRGGGGGSLISPNYEKFSQPSPSHVTTKNQPSTFSSQNYNAAPKPFSPAGKPAGSPMDNLTNKMTTGLSMQSAPPAAPPAPFQPSFDKYVGIDDSPGVKEPPKVIMTAHTTVPTTSGPIDSPASKSRVYNNPIGLYSAEAASTVLANPGRSYNGLKSSSSTSEGVKAYTPSETYKLVHEREGSGDAAENMMGRKISTAKTPVVTGMSDFKVVQDKDYSDSRNEADFAPTHSKTFQKLQTQYDDSGPQADGPVAKTPPVPVWQASKGQGAKPWSPAGAPPAPAPPPPSGGDPRKNIGAFHPTGMGAQHGKKGDAVFQQAPAGQAGRIPMCSSCGGPIRGPFVLAMGKSWCPDHFMCAYPGCGTKLLDIGFVAEGGQLYCEKDYERYFAPHCSKCGNSIVGECVNAMQKQYHPHCFVCVQCKQPIGGTTFHVEEGKPYCEKDWAAMYQTMCTGCGYPIEPGDRWVEAMEKNWHAECFNCSLCQCSLEGQPFYPKGGKPYCKKHAK